MAIDLKVDTRELRAAMQLYARATKKDEAYIINRAAKGILIDKKYGVIKGTRKADANAIERQFLENDNGFKLAAKRIYEGNKYFRRSRDATKKGSEIGARGRWQKRVGAVAKTLKGRAKSSVGYAVSGWLWCKGSFGLKGGAKKQFNKPTGRGTPAMEKRLVAILENFSENIEKVPGSASALQRAVNGEAKNMIKYANQQLEKTARQYSAKGAAIAKAFG